MAKINLKNIISKKNDSSALLLSVIRQTGAEVLIEDQHGNLLLGDAQAIVHHEQPIVIGDEIIGWVKGDEKGKIIAELLTILSQKEFDKKKLGSEVLHLYQEVNLIFNFSEKLAQTIDASAIAQIALDEIAHVIKFDSGAVVLWDDTTKKLQVAASKGGLFFDGEMINKHAERLMKIVLSGQSEIINDVGELIQFGIVSPHVKSIIYAALKVKHRIMGVIILASFEEANQYSAADLKLLITLALQSSSGIETALLYEKNIREANERAEAMRRIHEVTGKFVPYEFIRSLGHDVITDVKLGDQIEKTVTVVFTDIRDYTSFSEQMTPSENFSFVCSFNEHMGPVIRKHNGFINQYLGDAIMAIFPGSAMDALSAAIEMQKEVREFNARRQLHHQRPIQLGVGMHTGPLIMGITGDKDRMDAATISDTVNTASRIESLTKYYKANIIISDSTLQQITDTENFDLRPLGLVQVKGKREPLHIYECFSGNSEPELQKKLRTISAFNEGISNYLNKSFGKAFIAFQNVLETNPEDHTASFFLGKTARYITTGVPENWMGVEEMLNK
jgi:class 3 adenylate cyclase